MLCNQVPMGLDDGPVVFSTLKVNGLRTLIVLAAKRDGNFSPIIENDTEALLSINFHFANEMTDQTNCKVGESLFTKH